MPRLGIGLSLRSKLPPGAGVSVPVMVPYTILDDFETLTNHAASSAGTQSLHTGGRKILNSGGLRFVGNGTNGSLSDTRTALSSADPATWDVIAIHVNLNAASGDCAGQDLASLKFNFVIGATQYGLRVDTANGGGLTTDFTYISRGHRWLAFKANRHRVTDFNGAQLTASGAASKNAQIVMSAIANTANAPDIVVDAMILPDLSTHKSMFCIIFDDIGDKQYTDFLPALQSRGIVASMQVPVNLLNAGTKMTTAQALACQAGGIEPCLDSNRDDRPFSAVAATPALSVASLNIDRQDTANIFYGGNYNAPGLLHLCYGNGNQSIPDVTKTFSVTPNGTDTVAVTSQVYTFLSPGMCVRGASIVGDARILQCIDANNIKIDQVVPAGAAENWRFLGRNRGIAVTCNGTTTVTVGAGIVADLIIGQTMTGAFADNGTGTYPTIISFPTSTTIQMSAVVPATCVRANFDEKSQPWFGNKLHDELIANGYKSVRRNSGTAYYFTAYGLDPLVAMDMCGMTLDLTTNVGISATSVAAATANAITAIESGQDAWWYLHGNQPVAYFAQWLDNMLPYIAAGKLEFVNRSTYWARTQARVPIS